jgi:hypothetical protein
VLQRQGAGSRLRWQTGAWRLGLRVVVAVVRCPAALCRRSSAGLARLETAEASGRTDDGRRATRALAEATETQLRPVRVVAARRRTGAWYHFLRPGAPSRGSIHRCAGPKAEKRQSGRSGSGTRSPHCQRALSAVSRRKTPRPAREGMCFLQPGRESTAAKCARAAGQPLHLPATAWLGSTAVHLVRSSASLRGYFSHYVATPRE